MRERLIFLSALLFMIFGSIVPACAEGIIPGTFSLTPFLGGYFFSGEDDLKDGFTDGLGFGYHYNQNLAAELGLHYISTESEGNRDGDAAAWLFHLDALYHFTPDRKLVPYLVGGIGSISVDRNGPGDETDGLVNWGGGLRYFISERMALRGDLRHVIAFGDLRNNIMVNAGVVFLLGEGAGVGPPTPVDSDLDGVVDAKDECPNTPLGLRVDPKGCPFDEDGDGIFDDLDKCPGTPAGAKVDEAGCTIKIKTPVRIQLEVLFDTDKSVVKDAYRSELKKVADFMTAYPDTKAVIEGHTDNRGDDEYNRDLSQKRADAVMQYLILKLGLPASRLRAIGYGETVPITTNDTEEGRAQNRRVVAEITGIAVQ